MRTLVLGSVMFGGNIAHLRDPRHVAVTSAPPREVEPAATGSTVAEAVQKILSGEVGFFGVLPVVEEPRPLHPFHVEDLCTNVYDASRQSM